MKEQRGAAMRIAAKSKEWAFASKD